MTLGPGSHGADILGDLRDLEVDEWSAFAVLPWDSGLVEVGGRIGVLVKGTDACRLVVLLEQGIRVFRMREQLSAL